MSYKVEATVDGIKFLYDGGEVEVDYNASDSDVVRLTIEPLEVKVTDGFRAAVKKACNCDSSSGGLPDYSQASNGDVLAISSGEPTWTTPSGGGGGGVLGVHDVNGTLDKTWQEIHDSDLPILKQEFGSESISTTWAILAVEADGADYYVYVAGDDHGYYIASSPTEYPVYDGGHS